jgi:uncharacterized membrane protein YfcA
VSSKIFSAGNIKLRFALLMLFGFASGIVNGLLGAGGGILVVYALNYALNGNDIDSRDIYANALCVMLPISAVSCVRYAFSGNLHTEGFSVYAIPAIAGGIVGGFLLSKLRASVTKKLFAALVIWSGIILIIK